MNETLRKIANTIVANLANTESIGLFDGKMGVCLFLYKYARYSGCAIYEEIASSLLEDILRQLKPDMSPSAIDGLGGIGCGIVTLLREGFLESDPDDDVLCDIDEALLHGAHASFMKEVSYPIPLLSSGMYLLARISFRKEEVQSGWIAGTVENMRMVLENANRKYLPKLSLLNSMLYILCTLSEKLDVGRNSILRLAGEALSLSERMIDVSNTQHVDLLLLEQIVMRFPVVFQKEKERIIERVSSKKLSFCADIDFWYHNLWWAILYDMPILPVDSSDEMLFAYVDKKMRDSFYDEYVVNSRLSAVGLWLMMRKI